MSRRGITRGLPQAHTAPTTADGTITFTPAAAIVASAEVAGAGTVGFTPAAAIGAVAEIAGDMPVGFTPAGALAQVPSLTNLALWLRADAGITKDGSDAVSAWADQSTSGVAARDFSAAAGQEPTYFATGGPNSMPSVGSSDDTNAMTSGATPFAGLTAIHGFFVMKVANVGFARAMNFGSDAQTDHWPFAGPGGTVYSDFGSTARKNCGAEIASLRDWHLIEMVSTATEWTLLIDGVQQYTTGTNTVGFANPCVLFNDSAGGAGAAAHFAEVLAYSAKQTTERTRLVSYLNSRYGTAWV